MYDRVLAVADPTAQSQPAVARAATLARMTGGRVDLLICDYDDHLAGTRFGDSAELREGRERMMAGARARLEEMAAPLRQDGLDVAVHTSFFHPVHEGIIRQAGELNSSVIVKDTHFHHLLKRTVFSNTDWELIRCSPCDLLMVKKEQWAAQPVIMAAVDPLHVGDKPASLDHDILVKGRSLAEAAGALLKVIHCYPASIPAAASAAGMAAPAPVDVEAIRVSIETAHRRALDDLLESCRIDPGSVYMVAGEPRRQIVAMAEAHDADVVVAGAVSRSRLKKAFLGFTAQFILDRLPCDLLIVRARPV